jgi:putative ABC transport system substrate-binding protein
VRRVSRGGVNAIRRRSLVDSHRSYPAEWFVGNASLWVWTILLSSHVLGAEPATPPRIGYLSARLPGDLNLKMLKAFLQELRVLGYRPGETIIVEHRAFADREALPILARELVDLNPKVIVAGNTLGARAIKSATTSIPIVFATASDPVGSGLVRALSHPGENATGVTDIGVDLLGKQFDLLKQLVPNLMRIGVMGDPSDKVWDGIWSQAPEAARRLSIDIIPVFVKTPADMDRAFSDLNRRVQALVVAPQLLFSVYRRQIIELAAKARLPATYEMRQFPDSGALMSYGPNYAALFRRAAHFVDRILKGAKPADLPVEQPTEYELVINERTARELGLIIPPSILARVNDLVR